jgi:cation diffusion facilitator family transporter
MTKAQYSRMEGWISIFINTSLFILKYWAGVVSGSIALIADAWHTLSDSISSAFVLIGTKVSERPPDERHPFGHGRAELITAIFIGMFLAFIGYEFMHESISRLIEKSQETEFGKIAKIVTVISILLKEGLAQFAFWAYRKTKSNPLRADGWHHRTDAISSVLILIGIFLGSQFFWVDGVLGILVALMIFYSAFEIVRDAVDPLMGKTPDDQLIAGITAVCNKMFDSPIHAHHFHIHEYGDHTELTFHIVFPSDCTLKNAHDISTKIETEIRTKFSIEATIHMEPRGDEQDFHPELQ